MLPRRTTTGSGVVVIFAAIGIAPWRTWWQRLGFPPSRACTTTWTEVRASGMSTACPTLGSMAPSREDLAMHASTLSAVRHGRHSSCASLREGGGGTREIPEEGCRGALLRLPLAGREHPLLHRSWSSGCGRGESAPRLSAMDGTEAPIRAPGNARSFWFATAWSGTAWRMTSEVDRTVEESTDGPLDRAEAAIGLQLVASSPCSGSYCSAAASHPRVIR